MITQKRLKELLHYDPETGVFTRLVSTGNGINIGDIAGYLNAAGYIRIKIDGKLYYAHRLAVLYMTGKFPAKQVDHKKHIRSDNRWVSLRNATQLENARNACLRRDNKSGYSGIYFLAPQNRWLAKIGGGGECKYIGTYDTKGEAITARQDEERKLGYHENHGRVALILRDKR